MQQEQHPEMDEEQQLYQQQLLCVCAQPVAQARTVEDDGAGAVVCVAQRASHSPSMRCGERLPHGDSGGLVVCRRACVDQTDPALRRERGGGRQQWALDCWTVGVPHSPA